MVVHSWNSSTPEAEAEGSQFGGQPELHCESSVSKEAEGDRGKVECAKCLPHKHKELNPDHKHPHRKARQGGALSLIAGEAETRASIGLAGQPNIA